MQRTRLLVAAILMSAAFLGLPQSVFATGEAVCASGSNEYALQGSQFTGTEIGARATIEGQALPLCIFAGTFYGSGSFHWASVGTLIDPGGRDVVQVGYGRCLNANNSDGLGTLCDGNYYWYWAWGGACGGVVDGSYPGHGPLPIRIGAALSSPPSTAEFYVLRHTVGGVSRYEGYVNGSLLTGVNALGQTVSASVPASSVCWNNDNTSGGSGQFSLWFGETFNPGDSMGGWIGGVEHHLDYTSIQYSVSTGWLSPGFTFPTDCDGQTSWPPYRCKRTAANQLYIQTSR